LKKIFRKNQIIITALALMIAVAGYVSYTQSNSVDEEIASTLAETDADTIETSTDSGTDTLTTSTESGTDTLETSTDSVADTYDISDEDLVSEIFTDTEDDSLESDADVENPGETVLTSGDAVSVDFAAQVKLNREQIRSKNKETLLEIINNDSITDAQKQDAIDSMIAMTDVSERENAAELLLEAKGFSDVVVSITDDSADVVLDMGDVTDAKRAQVEDIVKRKTGISPENIVITPISGTDASE
jgi:stage III sporulation protein AH